MILRKFRGHFYDDVIRRDDSYLSFNEEVKIKDQDQRLTLVTLTRDLSGKFSVENNYYNYSKVFTNPFRPREGSINS